MSDNDRDTYLEDEDRLPWLEAVENDDDEDGLSTSKLIGLILAGLMVAAIGIGGYFWMNKQANETVVTDGTLIAAPEGPMKEAPADQGGMKVEGQGDAAFAVSEGAESNGKVAVNAGTEAPVNGIKVNPAAAAPVAGGPAGVTTVVPPSTTKPAAATVAVPAAAGSGAGASAGGALIQIGAFGSQATAEAGWTKALRANPALSSLPKVIQAAQVGGTTVYRLRANAGSAADAAAMCAKVSPCIIVR